MIGQGFDRVVKAVAFQNHAMLMRNAIPERVERGL